MQKEEVRMQNYRWPGTFSLLHFDFLLLHSYAQTIEPIFSPSTTRRMLP